MVVVLVIVAVVAVVVVVVVAAVDVAVQFMPSDNSRTSLPLNPQSTARSRSACVSDMSYTAAPAKGRGKRGGRRTKENRETPCGLHSCIQTSVSKCTLTTASSVGSSACAVTHIQRCRPILFLHLLLPLTLDGPITRSAADVQFCVALQVNAASRQQAAAALLGDGCGCRRWEGGGGGRGAGGAANANTNMQQWPLALQLLALPSCKQARVQGQLCDTTTRRRDWVTCDHCDM